MNFADKDYLTKLKDCEGRETVYEVKSYFLLTCHDHFRGRDISEVEYTCIFLKNNLKLEEKHMKKYIGTKLVQARPMTRGAYNRYRGWEIPADENPEDEGYLIQYPDGYVSWSPKGMFDHSYLEVDDNPQLPSGVSIGPGMVEAFIDRIEVMKLGERTTVVRCILKMGLSWWNPVPAWIQETIRWRLARRPAWRRFGTGYGTCWVSCSRRPGWG